MKFLLLIFLFFFYQSIFSQELSSTVFINSDNIETSDKYIFEEMKVAFEQFLNNQKWTEDTYKNEEKIKCNFIINIVNLPSISNFEASVQILSSRPVFNSSYESILLNHGDKDWSFEYVSSQPLEFNENNFNNNITSLLAFYAYIIIGMDNDSFEKLGGEKHFQKAWKIVNNAQQSSYIGWDQFGSNNNRYWMSENLLNPEFEIVRESFYNYHIKGLDIFENNAEKSRESIIEDLKNISNVNQIKPNSILIKSFINSKSNEISNIFSKGQINIRKEAYNILSKIDPSKSDNFSKILN